MMICAKLLIEIETLILHNGCNIKTKPSSVCSFKVHFIMISCCKEIYFHFQMSCDIYNTQIWLIYYNNAARSVICEVMNIKFDQWLWTIPPISTILSHTLTEHKKDVEMWRWKSRSWLGLVTKMCRCYTCKPNKGLVFHPDGKALSCYVWAHSNR
jgi:hypothetical protein